MTIAQDYAAYLKAPALYATVDTSDAGRWPDGRRLEKTSSFATVDGGVGEAARQAAFLGGAKARDVAIVPGRRSDLLGRVIIGRSDRLGYDAGVRVYVIGVEELANDTTALTILRWLA